MSRIILHVDANSFYASVELLDHPELRDKPVAVCGDAASRHGIILAKNEPAKACGVKTAEAIWLAQLRAIMKCRSACARFTTRIPIAWNPLGWMNAGLI